MDDFNIDSHKLNYHIDRVYDWFKGKNMYPLYIEITPTNSCNHRCIFCAFDYLKYKPIFIEKAPLKRFLSEIAQKGVKSIMYGGEGEPLLHKDIAEFIIHSKEKGLDAAVTTNGILFDKRLCASVLGKLTWVRMSVDAASAKTYSKIHRCKESDFKKVLSNLENAVKLKRSKKYKTTIGVQFLLLNQNYDEAPKMAKILKDIGVDYLIIKPYSHHPFSLNELRLDLNYKRFLFLDEKLKKYSKDGFQVIFRKHTMEKLGEKRPYEICYGLSFWSYLTSKGEVYACSCFLGDKRFYLGNIYKESFSEIWNGKRRRKFLKMMEKKWDIKNCRVNCRMDEINRYLWNLKFPPEHVNFI
ncbi:MAG: radical SAM protein [Candidatus Omnitrophota bacterium]